VRKDRYKVVERETGIAYSCDVYEKHNATIENWQNNLEQAADCVEQRLGAEIAEETEDVIAVLAALQAVRDSAIDEDNVRCRRDYDMKQAGDTYSYESGMNRACHEAHSLIAKEIKKTMRQINDAVAEMYLNAGRQKRSDENNAGQGAQDAYYAILIALSNLSN